MLRSHRKGYFTLILVGIIALTPTFSANAWDLSSAFQDCYAFLAKKFEQTSTFQKVAGALGIAALTYAGYRWYKRTTPKASAAASATAQSLTGSKKSSDEERVVFSAPAPAASPTRSIAYEDWKKRCESLPYYEETGKNFKQSALHWSEFKFVLDEFFQVMKSSALADKANWVATPPALSDSFFDPKKKIFKPFVQKFVVPQDAEVDFKGDLHGDIKSLMKYIDTLQKEGYLDGFKIIKDNFYMVFLGDYTDRGNYGTEVLYTLMQLKIAKPERVILVRGNHEDIEINMGHGFAEEFYVKFSALLDPSCSGFDAKSNTFKALGEVSRLYDFLPVALYLGSGSAKSLDFLQCCHGGMEIGYVPHQLLNKEGLQAFEWLGDLKQRTEFDNLKVSKEALGDCGCSAAKEFTDYDESKEDHKYEFKQIGFMWNYFSTDPKCSLSKQSNIFVYGKHMTDAVLHRASEGMHKIRGVMRAHQHSHSKDNPMMQSIFAGKGISRLWQAEENKDQGFEFNLWPGIVCTFLVAPECGYRHDRKAKEVSYDYDVWGRLNIGDRFEKWKMHVRQNQFPYRPLTVRSACC